MNSTRQAAAIRQTGDAVLPALLGLGTGLVIAWRPELTAPLLVTIALLVAALVVRDPMQTGLFALLAGTVIFGREFSQISMGPIFVTEATLALLSVLLVIAGRTAGLPRRVRWLLIAYFGAGAIALLIGLGSGLYWVARDSVLVAYAVLIWLVAATLKTETDAKRLLDVMFWAGVAATIAWTAGVRYPSNAFGVYTAFTYLPVLASWADGRRVEPWKLGIVAVQLYYLVSVQPRASWVAFAAALVVLVLSRPRRLERLGHLALGGLATGLAAIWILLPSLAGSELLTKASGIRPGGESGSARNTQWRIDYWEYELKELAAKPTGRGFGPPSSFCPSASAACEDTRFDRSLGEVTGPHNSFVNIAYRLGVQGFVILVILLAAILVPAWRLLIETRDTTIRVALLMFTFSAVTAFFSVSLEGPYMAVPFWTLLGALIVLVRSQGLRAETADGRFGSRPAHIGPSP